MSIFPDAKLMRVCGCLHKAIMEFKCMQPRSYGRHVLAPFLVFRDGFVIIDSHTYIRLSQIVKFAFRRGDGTACYIYTKDGSETQFSVGFGGDSNDFAGALMQALARYDTFYEKHPKVADLLELDG